MTARSASFRVGRVRAYLRGRVWYLAYQEHGTRSQFSRGLLLRPASLSVMNVAWTGRSRMNRFAR